MWTDFDYYVSSAQIGAYLEPVTPIAGVSSLAIARLSGASIAQENWAAGATLTRGVTRGRLRCRVRPYTLSSESDSYGLLCMLSQHNVAAGAGSGYGLVIRGANIDLFQFTAGVVARTQLATAALPDLTPSWLVNQVIQLVWVADQQSTLGGTYLAGYHALGTDFAALTLKTSFVDRVAPFTTSVNEGGFADASHGLGYLCLFDSLRMEGP